MVLQYPLNQRDAVFQHCGRYQRSSSKSSTVSEHFPISICFRNRLEVKSTRLDVHEQILNSYFRALCSKCNIQSSGGGVCLIFFFAVLRRLDLPPPISPSYGSHAAIFFPSPDLIILHLCFFCLKWGSGNRKNIFLSCKVDVNK